MEERNERRLTQEEVKEITFLLLNVAQLTKLCGPSDEELRLYIELASRVDAVVPIIDPTLWMRGAKKNECLLKIARALATFRASLPTREETEEADRVAASFG